MTTITELIQLGNETAVHAAANVDEIWAEIVTEYQRRGYDTTVRPAAGSWGDRAITCGLELKGALADNWAALPILRDLQALMTEEA